MFNQGATNKELHLNTLSYITVVKMHNFTHSAIQFALQLECDWQKYNKFSGDNANHKWPHPL